MWNWRSVDTRKKLSVMSKQLLTSVKGDVSLLTQPQRDMLAAIAINDGSLTFEEAKSIFSGAKSSINFARVNLRSFSPQINAAALLGIISTHTLDKLRRRLGSYSLVENHILGMADEEITRKYPYKSLQKDQIRVGLTKRQLAAQYAANVRWGNINVSDKPIVALPEVTFDREAFSQALDEINMAFNKIIKALPAL